MKKLAQAALWSLCTTGYFVGMAQEASLRAVFKDNFHIGTALNHFYISGKDPDGMALVERQFNSITAENIMKWERIHPKPDQYQFDLADKFVEIGTANDWFVVGHTLIWHNQTPDWLYTDKSGALIDSTVLFQRMKEHISTVMGRYKGRVHGWDVVNEALNEDGTLRNSKFYKIAGEDYIAKAFEYAQQADPDAELYYNDYSMNNADKTAGAIAIVKKLQAKGLRVDGIGMQGHWGLNRPPLSEIENSILAISEAGMKVMITELDITVLPNPRGIEGADLSKSFENHPEANPYKTGLPDSVQEALANRYAEIFELFNKHSDKISRVTFWGVHDGNSWKNNWPARGRTDYTLLFDRKLQPKPAFHSVVGTLPTE